MKPSIHDAAYLWDMLTHAREAVGIVKGHTLETFRQDLTVRRATQHVVMIIGEAASKVSKPFREAHSQIPWRPIVAMRHRLVHEYSRIDDEKVWRVASHYVPQLIPMLEKLLPPPPPDPQPERSGD